MGRVEVRRVLGALGAVTEATSTEESAFGVLASSVAVVGAEGAGLTLLGPSDPTTCCCPERFLLSAPAGRAASFDRTVSPG